MKFLLLTLATILLSIPVASAEFIRSFDTNIQILDADTMMVTETIAYDFEDEWRHGIFRTIPGNIEFLEVISETSTPYPFATTSNYNESEAKIGDPNATITGPHTYQITYLAKNELRFFREHDELYWNVNGTNWEVPIQSSSATITFPFTFKKNDPQLRTACYTGYTGSTDSNCTTRIETTNNQTVFTFQTTEPLLANNYFNQNMTIVAGIPRTFLEKKPRHIDWAQRTWGWRAPTPLEKAIAYLLREGLFIMAALILFLGTFKSWLKKVETHTHKYRLLHTIPL